MRIALWVLVGWLLGAASAHAQSGVLLRDQVALRPGLCAALRIQLSGVSEVTCTPDPGGRPLSERIAETAAAVKASDARLGVLLEPDPDPGLVRLYILSSRVDQAVLSIERVENRPGPDIDRSLALKVRDAYEVVAYVAAQPDAPAPRASLAAAITPAAPHPPPEGTISSPAQGPRETSQAVPRAWRLLLDVGGGMEIGPGLRAMATAGLGISRPIRRARVEGLLGARLYSQRAERREGTHVRMVERGPFAEGRWLRRFGRVELGGALSTQLSVIAADGTARDGTRGTRRQLSFLLGAFLDLRVALFSGSFLRFAPGLEVPLPRRAWSVDHITLLRDQPVRVALPLSFVVLLPVQRASKRLQP